MKELKHKRKVALKQRRDMILRRKNLRKDIADFLIKWCLRLCHDPHESYSAILGDGFKGYYKMRGSELVKKFDSVYSFARKPSNSEMIFKTLKNSYGQRARTISYQELYEERDPSIVLEEIIFDSDAIMSRLMELAFNLETDE